MRAWTPERDISVHRVVYNPRLQCGICGGATVEVIATVGLCEACRARLYAIAGTAVNAESQWLKPRSVRKRKKRLVTATCRCGATFTYSSNRGHRAWCDPCTRSGSTTAIRMEKLTRRQRAQKEG